MLIIRLRHRGLRRNGASHKVSGTDWRRCVRTGGHRSGRCWRSGSNGALYFVSGEGYRKARNLARDSRCVITLATQDADLVVEGEAAKVHDEFKLNQVAAAYASKYGWHVTVRDGAFDAEYGAPTASPPPYEVYELTPATVFGFGTAEKFSPTRWRF